MSPVENYLYSQMTAENEEQKQDSNRLNNSPCTHCGYKDFVRKFRKVVGEMHGNMESYFGGGLFYACQDISFSIDGSIDTLPVFSCRNCGEEREIATYEEKTMTNIFWDDMYYFYFGIDENSKSMLSQIPQIYLSNPKSTFDFMNDFSNVEYDFYNKMILWSPEVWIMAGFNIKKEVKSVPHKFLSFKWFTEEIQYVPDLTQEEKEG